MINQIGGHLGIYVDIIFMIFICKKKEKKKANKKKQDKQIVNLDIALNYIFKCFLYTFSIIIKLLSCKAIRRL